MVRVGSGKLWRQPEELSRRFSVGDQKGGRRAIQKEGRDAGHQRLSTRCQARRARIARGSLDSLRFVRMVRMGTSLTRPDSLHGSVSVARPRGQLGPTKMIMVGKLEASRVIGL